MAAGPAPDADILGDAFRAIQRHVAHDSRDVMAGALAAAVKRRVGPGPAQSPEDAASADALRRDGVLPLGPVLGPAQADDVVAFLAARPCHAGHVAAQSTEPPAVYSAWLGKAAQASYRIEAVVRAPHLWELVLDPRILGLVETYLGCAPTLYSINAFWSLPGFAPSAGLQVYHRDYDDFRFCAFFIVLTESTREDGAHLYVRGSHRAGEQHDRLARSAARLVAAQPETRSHFDQPDGLFAPIHNPYLDALIDCEHADDVMAMHGPRGLGFVEDTFGLHKGVPARGPRLLFWARYGLYRNRITVVDRTEPVDAHLVEGRVAMTDRLRYVTRLLIR